MAYIKLEKSGCEERRGNVKLRLDFFLEPGDPRYADRYLELVDTTSLEYLAGYQGEVDERGNPVNQAQYDTWFNSLPKVWTNTPFHSHFIYANPDVTDIDIKKEMDFHLSNFYTAFQNRWDEVQGGMRHGWATEKRIRPTDYSKEADYATRKSLCEARVNALTELSSKPDIVEGKEYPATDIDIGPGAIDRANSYPFDYTFIDLENPANDTGTIDTFEVYAKTTMNGTNKVGTFSGSGTSYTNRDGETIGTVTSGAKRTFTGLTIAVSTGDFAGIYYSVGAVERDTSGFSGLNYKQYDQFGAGVQTYVLMDGNAISLYATGETLGWSGKIAGVTNPASIAGVLVANIASVKGVA